jgi:hypothetical protein
MNMKTAKEWRNSYFPPNENRLTFYPESFDKLVNEIQLDANKQGMTRPPRDVGYPQEIGKRTPQQQEEIEMNFLRSMIVKPSRAARKAK